MNQNFVRKARHKGTAAWFFESSILTDWNARGSFLWIHGKRMLFQSLKGAWTNKMVDLKAGAGKSTLLYVMVL
jgi:hypothetical protein